jgi:hypothetical protein
LRAYTGRTRVREYSHPLRPSATARRNRIAQSKQRPTAVVHLMSITAPPIPERLRCVTINCHGLTLKRRLGDTSCSPGPRGVFHVRPCRHTMTTWSAVVRLTKYNRWNTIGSTTQSLLVISRRGIKNRTTVGEHFDKRNGIKKNPNSRPRRQALFHCSLSYRRRRDSMKGHALCCDSAALRNTHLINTGRAGVDQVAENCLRRCAHARSAQRCDSISHWPSGL